MNHSIQQIVLLYQVSNDINSILIDLPFLSGQYTHGFQAFYRLPTNYVYHDSSIQVFIPHSIVSSTLADQIKSHLYTIPTTSICGSPLVIQNDNDCYKFYQTGWSSIVVNEGLCNSITESLSISNNTCLQYIYIQSGSLKNINSLTISNLPELKYLIFEYGSFSSTTSLTLSSIF